MADFIFDLNDNPLTAGQLQLPPSDEEILTIRVECRAGFILSSTAAANLSVEARRVGDSSWTNIESGSFDLSTWAGTRQNIEIRLTSGAVSAITRNAFSLRITQA